MIREGPIVELTFTVDDDSASRLDEWLDAHFGDTMLAACRAVARKRPLALAA